MRRHRWLYWIKVLAGVALVVILFQKINQRDSILAILRVVDWMKVGICAALVIPNISVAYLKWHYLLKKRFNDVSRREVFGSLLFGYTLGLITPGRLGELGRGLFFQDKDRLTITGLNVLDKVASQVVIITLGGFALLYMLVTGQGAWHFSNAIWIFSIGVALLLGLWMIVLNPRLIQKLTRRLQARFSAASKLRSLIAAFDNLSFQDSAVVLGLSLLWYLLIIFQYHIVVSAFTDVSVGESYLAVSAMLLIKTLLPFTFGDLGIREGVAMYFYSRFSIPEAAVFNASLLIFLFNLLLPALCGIYYVFQLKETMVESPEPLDEPAEEILSQPFSGGKWPLR